MQNLGVSPIHQVQISDEGFPLAASLHRQAMQVDALGYVVENWVTEQALQQQLRKASRISWFRPARVQALMPHPGHITLTLDQAGYHHQLAAQLVVGADDRQSFVRQQAHSQGRDLGDTALLRQYQHQRQRDSQLTLFGTDFANRLFSNAWRPLQWLRWLGLSGLEQVLPLKKLFMQRARGIANALDPVQPLGD
jgi:2-polyprenyl-6-methoxyphenol hydroxylase-like FAD-dependent oxidoreductase